jgi:heptosyltransferase-1
MRILIIKTTSLGDVVHNLPVIADIKKHHPNALIDWVVEESFVDILNMHPEINQVIPVAVRRWRKALFCRKTWHELATFKRQLQANTYDMVIDTQGLLKSALICYLSRSANKCGYDKISAREPVASYFYHHRFLVSLALHAVQRNRELVALALGYTIASNALDYGIQTSTHLSATSELPAHFILALHGTSRDSKLWPVTHWISLGKVLESQGLSLVLPWGNQAELLRAKQIASETELAIVLPKLSISALASITQKSQAVIGVDTGLAHLAVALNKPVIAIYTDTDPKLTGLYATNQQACKNLGGKEIDTSLDDVLTQLKAFEVLHHD